MKPTLRMITAGILFCGLLTCDWESLPPESCAAIPTQTLHVGENVVVRPCFTDESGNELVYMVTSSDNAVATIAAASEGFILSAHSPGEAVITIEASNGSLTGEVMFKAEVPNRQPVILKEFIPIQLHEDSVVNLNLSSYFADPDSQSLAYTAEPVEGLVRAIVANTLLTLTPIMKGETYIVVTAMDPGGEEVSQDLLVSVYFPGISLEDQFDSDQDHWIRYNDNSDYEISEGFLRLWTTESEGEIAGVRWDGDVGKWDVAASLQYDLNEKTLAGLIVEIVHQRYEMIFFHIGDDENRYSLGRSNYRIWFWDKEREDGSEGWVTTQLLLGTHEHDELGFNTLEILSSSGLLEFLINDQRVAYVEGESPISIPLKSVIIVALSPVDSLGGQVVTDWITITGISSQIQGMKDWVPLLELEPIR